MATALSSALATEPKATDWMFAVALWPITVLLVLAELSAPMAIADELVVKASLPMAMLSAPPELAFEPMAIA